MVSQTTPDDRAFDFDPAVVLAARPLSRPGRAQAALPSLSWRDLAGLTTAVAAVPATVMVLIFAAVTAYGPLYLAERPVRIGTAQADVATTGSIVWTLRGTLDE